MPSAPQPKRLDYDVTIDRLGRVEAEGCEPLHLGETWTAEHLVLAGLVRCSLTSLRYHARRSGVDVIASGYASGVVTKRESDGRYGFVEVECRFDVELDETGDADLVRELLERAERDCFIGASLEPRPVYRWRVNGREIQ